MPRFRARPWVRASFVVKPGERFAARLGRVPMDKAELEIGFGDFDHLAASLFAFSAKFEVQSRLTVRTSSVIVTKLSSDYLILPWCPLEQVHAPPLRTEPSDDAKGH